MNGHIRPSVGKATIIIAILYVIISDLGSPFVVFVKLIIATALVGLIEGEILVDNSLVEHIRLDVSVTGKL